MTRRHAELPRLLLLLSDVVAALVSSLLAYGLRFHAGIRDIPGRVDVLPARYLEALPVVVAALLAAVALAGAYRRERLGRTAGVADGLLVALFAMPLLGTMALFYWKQFQYSRLALVLASALFGICFVGLRRVTGLLLSRLRRSGRFRTPALVVGGGAPAAALARTVAETPWTGLDITGILPMGPVPAALQHVARVQDLDALCALLEEQPGTEVFVALPADRTHDLGSVLGALSAVPANVRVVPDLGGTPLMNASAAVLAGVPIVSVREQPLYGARALAKRVVDVVLAATLLALLAPVLALLALLIRLSSPGPALFRQVRMGLNGEAFEILKFRTMALGAEEGTGPVFTRPGDARVTGLGRLLRRLSLDELPQLINVLRGEMSLVGPRPERPPFIQDFRKRFPGYMLRHSVKAGMTGWAQVHGLRGDTSLEDRLRYDLEYIDRWSLWFDLEILGRTAVQVLIGRNAY